MLKWLSIFIPREGFCLITETDSTIISKKGGGLMCDRMWRTGGQKNREKCGGLSLVLSLQKTNFVFIAMCLGLFLFFLASKWETLLQLSTNHQEGKQRGLHSDQVFDLKNFFSGFKKNFSTFLKQVIVYVFIRLSNLTKKLCERLCKFPFIKRR